MSLPSSGVVGCPTCGAPGQEVGKYCDNCGAMVAAGAPGTGAPVGAATQQPAVTQGLARFGLVGEDGTADEARGFSLSGPAEVLVGRPDPAPGAEPVGIDLRSWVQPYEVEGQKMYLVHRKQCYLVVRDDGSVAIRPCAGAEGDTFVKPAAGGGFTPLSGLAALRSAGQDGAFPLSPGDRVYMGDPTALTYYQRGEPTARGSYVLFELLGSA